MTVSSTNQLTYSAVIATLDRPDSLAMVLDSLMQQTRPPSSVILVDSSSGNETSDLAERIKGNLPLLYVRAPNPSAAEQRNLGALSVSTPLIAFVDDDVVLPPQTFSRLVAPFEAENGHTVGGVAGHIEGLGHPKPRGLLWWYYRLQAGYSHPNFGARLFGPAINTHPCYEEQSGLISSDWLNSTCVLYWSELFARERFPDFEGYSFMEDVHLSARIARTHRLLFDSEAVYEHNSAPTPFKMDKAAYAAAAMRSRRIVARDVMGLSGLKLEIKMFVHRLFDTIALAKAQNEGWLKAIRGTWS
jgi:glycosyltransferase involved in cell wall biosynthesis